MKSHICRCAVALLLAGALWTAPTDKGEAAASAFQTYAQVGRLFLNAAQEQFILRSLAKYNPKEAAVPPGFFPEIGAVVPNSIALRPLPSIVTDEVWATMSYDYVFLQNELLIVSPKDRTVEDIIVR
jgi:hypothetical protein